MALTHVYPFGNNTVVVNDMKNQYLLLMTYPRNFIYSYQLSLGGNFAYYLNPTTFSVSVVHKNSEC